MKACSTISKATRTAWKVSVLERLARADQLAAYRHAGFWQCMDTMRDKQALERLWASDVPPWKRW
jgi:glucose-1-phosphate cytidylyltransferase